MLGMINRTMVYRSPDILLSLYKSLVRSHLEYCVGLVAALCERSGKVGEGTAQVYENGIISVEADIKLGELDWYNLVSPSS